METNNLTAPIAVEKDRNTLTIELMNRMKLHGMAAAFTESLTSTMAETMTIRLFPAHVTCRGMGLPCQCSHPTPYTRGGVPLQGLPRADRLCNPAWP